MGRTENLIDMPLNERDAAALFTFYEKFLNKSPNDSLALMKAAALVRRSDLREFVHTFAMMRKRLETLIREPRQRDLLLSFPSTIQRVHQLVWEGQEAYGDDGSTVQSILGGQAVEYLDQTEMFRMDLDGLLSDCPSMLPDDVEALKQTAAAGHGAHLFLLVALADHVFLTLLPHDHPQPTEAVLRARTFLQERFGEKFEDQIIEFFVLGGGYVRAAGSQLVLCGVHPLFDPVFSEFGGAESQRFISEFVRGKFRLALYAIRNEMADQKVAVQA